MAEAETVASAALTAVTVTLGPGIVAGAVYRPPDEIVPLVELPPAAPFTCQLTFEFVVPETIAVNCCVALAARTTLPGETVTTMMPGLVDCGPPLHELSTTLMRVSAESAATNFELSAPSMFSSYATHDVCHLEAANY
jgi:hypothetical protein